MSFIHFHSCATCQGLDSQSLFTGLLENPSLKQTSFFEISNKQGTYFSRITHLLENQVAQFESQNSLNRADKWGLILGSTKGLIEDYVWDTEDFESFDVFNPLLEEIKRLLPFSPSQVQTVSNACTSSHGAFELAQRWLRRDQVDHVMVVAADLIGPFTLKGFQSLRALTQFNQPRPFDEKRDGLKLGDGVGLAVLSRTPSEYELGPVSTLIEGVSATRPNTSGESLAKCFISAMGEKTPELVIAHGTGTHYNDITESAAIKNAFKDLKPPRVTCSKWAVGHALGASGMIDLNLAIEILKNQKVPAIATLNHSNLPIQELLVNETLETPVESVLVSSLGFGGMNSAFQVVRRSQ